VGDAGFDDVPKCHIAPVSSCYAQGSREHRISRGIQGEYRGVKMIDSWKTDELEWIVHRLRHVYSQRLCWALQLRVAVVTRLLCCVSKMLAIIYHIVCIPRDNETSMPKNPLSSTTHFLF